MANLQIKDINDALYSLLREKGLSEHRTISQTVVTILENYFANPRAYDANPAQELLALSGSFKDSRSAEKISRDIRSARTKNDRYSIRDVFD